MKRFLALSLALLVLILGTRALFRALAADETKIRWMLEEMEEGFNEGDVGDTIGPIGRDWSHDLDPRASRDNVRQWLVGRSFQGRDSETKKLLTRMDLDFESLVITVDGETATFEIPGVYEKMEKEEWTVEWRFLARGEWRDGPNGWFLHRTSHEDVQGTSASL